MSTNLVQGTVHAIENIQQFGTNGFRKRVVVLEQDNGKYLNYIPVEFVNDDCDKVNSLELNSNIEVKFFPNGRKWQKDAQSEVKYFVSLRAVEYTVLDMPKDSPTEVPSASNADASIPF